MSRPTTPEEILPAVRAALASPDARLGRHRASIRFDLASVGFRVGIRPDGVDVFDDLAGDGPLVRMPAERFLSIIDGSTDLHLLFLRDEVEIVPKEDVEAQLLAKGALVRLVAALSVDGSLEGTLIETLYREMDVRTYRSSIPAPCGQRLYDLVRKQKPEHTLEIGLAHGLSTLCIALALEHNGAGTHYANDPFQRTSFKSSGLKNVERAGLSHRVVHLEKPDYVALPELLAQGKRFQLVFIDGCHFADYTMVDFFYSDLLLDDGGLLLIDDAHLAEVDLVVQYVLDKRASSYELVQEQTTERMAVLRRRGPDARNEAGLKLVERPRVA